MAGLDREPIYAALFTRLQTLVAIPQTPTQPLAAISRRLPPAVVPGPTEQPCAFVPCGKETPDYSANLPYKWRLHPAIIVYARTDEASQAPSSVLAPIVKAIEAALQFQPGDGYPNLGAPTTLGQLCSHVAIGQVEYGEGVPDGQGVAFIPLEILAVEK